MSWQPPGWMPDINAWDNMSFNFYGDCQTGNFTAPPSLQTPAWEQMQHNGAFQPQPAQPMGSDFMQAETALQLATDMNMTNSTGDMVPIAQQQYPNVQKHSEQQPHRESVASQPRQLLEQQSHRESVTSQRSEAAEDTLSRPRAESQSQPPAPSNARVPIPPQSQTTPAATGPMSTTVTIPPRPRPGRKPIAQAHAADRRRLQNRIAQRNFRDKRQQKLMETQVELEDNKQIYREEVADFQRKLDVERKARLAAEEETARVNKRVEELEKLIKELRTQLHAVHTLPSQGFRRSHGRYATPSSFTAADLPILNTAHPGMPILGYGGAPILTPPEDNPNEIDFTYLSRAAQRPSLKRNRLHSATSSESMNSQMDFSMSGSVSHVDDRCGFCTDDQNCSCKAEKRAAETAITPAPSVPGSCDACQNNPARAQACRELAAQTQIMPRPSTTFDTTGQIAFPSSGSMSTMPPPSVPCSTIVEKFAQHNETISSALKLFGGRRLHGWAGRDGGYEIEEHEAAQVLQNLSRRNTVISLPGEVVVVDQ